MYNVMKFQAPFERLKDYNLSPEVSLHKAIITQAIIDATNASSLPKARALEKEAKDWIFGKGDYFQKICHIAGIEPDFVIKITKEAIRLNHKKFELDKLRAEKTLAKPCKRPINVQKLKIAL